MKATAKWGISIGAILVFAAIGSVMKGEKPSTPSTEATPAFKPDPRGVAMAKLLTLDDYATYIDGGDSLPAWSKATPLGERLTARAYHAAYQANEVAADDRFKGKPVTVTATIGKISKDAFGSVYLELPAGGMFESVQAFLADETAARAGEFPQGAKITLVCAGGGMLVTFPILKDCQSGGTLVAMQKPKIDAMADELFSGHGADTPDDLKKTMAMGYVMGTLLPPGSACETAVIADMSRCSGAIDIMLKSRGKKELDEAFLSISKQIGLSPKQSG